MFDCDFASSSKTAGGIAAVNNGTIDHCISGVNLTTGTLHINEDIVIDPAVLNSDIKGEISGGIAGENNGLIIGSRNAAVVTGSQCGGIAAVNTGRIYGCANNAAISSSNTSVSGGLAGKNSGKIESSYNSGNVTGSSEQATGSIAGLNGYDGGEKPAVKNVFYSTVKGMNAVGTDSSVMPDATNKAMSRDFDFHSSSFVDELNAVSDETVVWVQNSLLNDGNPTIKGNFLKYSVKSAGNDITVAGNMHEALNIDYSVCSQNSAEYQAIINIIGNSIIHNLYSASLTDNDGNYIPAELWCQGNFKISVPVDNKNVQLAGIDEKGQVTYYTPDSVKNGVAVFTVSHPVSFAIVENTDDGNQNPTTSDNNMSDTVFLIAFASLSCLIWAAFMKKRNNVG